MGTGVSLLCCWNWNPFTPRRNNNWKIRNQNNLMPNDFDVILRFILDQASQQKTNAGVDQLTVDLSDVDKILRAATKDFEALEKAMEGATSVKEVDRLEQKFKELDQQLKEITKSYSVQARVLRAEAAGITSDFEKARVAQIKGIGDRIGGASRTGLAVSGAVVGGILAEANRFAKEAEDTGKATAATREWTAATKELAEARSKVDAVLLRESLPLLQQAAKVASEASQFIERNPEIVQAALKVGVVVAGLSAVGLAVAKGIRLYADVQALALGAQELAAAKLQDIAADKQLIAARLRAGQAGVDVPTTAAKGAGGIGTALTSPAGIVTLVAATTAASIKAADSLKKLEERLIAVGGPAAAPLIAFLDTLLQTVNPLVPAIKNFRVALERDVPIIQNLLGMVSDASPTGSVGGRTPVRGAASGPRMSTETQDALVASFTKFQEDDARLVQEAAEKRVKIIADSERRIVDETAKYSKQVASINDAANKRAASLRSNFLQETAQAEANYQVQRAKIIRDGAEAIQDIEEASQERLRKLALEHGDRVQELTASRDALGLAREKRRFSREQEEENRGIRAEIAKRQQDTAERLAELDREHKLEQAQRLAQFQQALAENEAQRKEQLQAAAAAHAEELAQIRAQKAQQLRELAEGLNQERLRRREVFLAEIRDLDAALLGEKSLKARYYNLMLADADRFLAAYRSRMASVPSATTGGTTGGTTGTHFATGGYASGIVSTGEKGVEYILSNRTTRAAEQVIGGRLTQDSILSALTRTQTDNSQTYNLSFPGGLVTIRQLGEILDAHDHRFLKRLTKGLVAG